MSVVHIKSITEFDKIIKENKSVIADFSAQWCGPCKKIAPKFETMAKNHNNIKFVKVDIDEVSDLASKYKIEGIPTFILFNDGKESDKVVGASLPSIEKLIEHAKNQTKHTTK